MTQQQQQQQQRRRQQQDEIVGGDDDDNDGDDDDDGACDESKCVSDGMGRDFGEPHNSPFTCYTDRYHSMMCADGFKPRIVESEPPAISDVLDDDYSIVRPLMVSKSYQYFTCCPPKLLTTETNVGRHCSDPIINLIEPYFDDDSVYINETIVCNDASRPFSRQMKTKKNRFSERGYVESYMCCDSAQNKSASFLDDTECVPYRNELYQEATAGSNSYGTITRMTHNNIDCVFPDSDFHFPRFGVIHGRTQYSHECCKTEHDIPPFVQNADFKKTVYPQIVISSIAVLSCMIVIVGLSIPLLKQLRKQRTQMMTHQTNRIARHRGAFESDYSTYNLYLVYLAIPDLILNLYLLGMYGSYANQKYNPNFHGAIIYDNFIIHNPNRQNHTASNFEGAFVVACSTANLYLNAVVSYEVFILLRNCHLVQRTNPPSLLKVTLQAVAVYFVAIMVFIIHYCIARAASAAIVRSQQDDTFYPDFDRYYYLLHANVCWSLVVTFVLPIGFCVCVSIAIRCRGYMPSATGRMKELAWYFFRIIVVFCVLWIPGMSLLHIFAAANRRHNSHYISRRNITIGLLFCAMQPIVSMCMAMTKTDVRKHIFDLVTLSYIRKSKATTIATVTAPVTAPAAAAATAAAATATISQEEKISSTTVLLVVGTKEEEKVAETLAAKDAADQRRRRQRRSDEN